MKVDYRLNNAEIIGAITAYLEKHYGAKAYQAESIVLTSCGRNADGNEKIVATATFDTARREPVNPRV